MRRTRVGLTVLAACVGMAGLSTVPASAVAEPDGCNQILVSDSNVDHRIVELDGSGETSFSARHDPTWSSDGDFLAWSDSSELTIAGPDGSPIVKVTADDLGLAGGFQGHAWASWYPAVILTTQLNGHFIIATDGTVHAGPYPTLPALSPAGHQVAVPRPDGLWIETVAGDQVVELTAAPPQGATFAWNQFPAWSADGTYVAWWASNSGAGDPDNDAVWVAHADGSALERLGDSRRGAPDFGRPVSWIGGTHRVMWRDHDGQDGAGLVNESVWAGGPAQTVEQQWSTPHGYMGTAEFTVDGRYFHVDEANVVLYVFEEVWPFNLGIELPYEDYPYDDFAFARDGSFAIGSATSDDLLLNGPGGKGLEHSEGNDPKYRPCPAFVDISTASFALHDISVIRALGITKGTSPALFSPLDPVTREQMAAFLARLWEALGNECGGTLGEFVDVPESSFAYEAVACIKDLGVTKGTGDGTTYSPADLVTREQMAAFLARLWEALGNECGGTPGEFVDVAESSFAYEAVACIKAIGVTTGTSPTTYSPANSVTREQMAAFIGRFWRAA